MVECLSDLVVSCEACCGSWSLCESWSLSAMATDILGVVSLCEVEECGSVLETVWMSLESAMSLILMASSSSG